MTQTKSSSPTPNVLFLLEVVNANDGIASYLKLLAGGLKERGVNVYLASGNVRYDEKTKVERDLLEASLTEWRVYPQMRKFPSLALLNEIKALIKERNISVIHAHGLGMLMIARLLALQTGLPMICTYHPSVLGSIDNVLKDSKRKFGLKQQLFLNLFFPDKLIVLSEESKEFLRSHWLPRKDDVIKILGCTDLSLYRRPTLQEREKARASFALAPEDFVILLLGRLAWVKGHDLVVKAVRKLRASNPDISVKCLFVGSGGKERETEIKAFAYQDEADRKAFNFLGFVEDKRDALWASDMFVMPSRFEGFGISVIEAQAAGLVPVRTPSGGARDQIVEGKTGFVVPFEDVDALAAAMLRLTDAELRSRMSEQSCARAHELFAVEPMTTAMIDIYGYKTA